MSSETKPQRDIIFCVIIGLVACVTLWLLLTPFVSAVAMSTMKRFHLRSDSFTFWCAQQVVPSMYNFGNTVQVHNVPPDMIVPIINERPRYLNHFPARRITFGDARYNLLRRGDHRWFDLKTTYRGLELKTRVHANPIGDGAYELIHMDPEAGADSLLGRDLLP